MYSHIHGVANASGAVACGLPSRWCAMWLLYQFTTKAEREDAAVITEVAVHVGGAFPRDHRLQRRRLEARDQPLRHREVRDAVGPDAAVAPGCRPAHSIAS